MGFTTFASFHKPFRFVSCRSGLQFIGVNVNSTLDVFRLSTKLFVRAATLLNNVSVPCRRRAAHHIPAESVELISRMLAIQRACHVAIHPYPCPPCMLHAYSHHCLAAGITLDASANKQLNFAYHGMGLTSLTDRLDWAFLPIRPV